MNDTCSGCRDAEGFTYMEQQFVINLDSIGHPYYRWVNRCRKESTCEKFKKVKEFKMNHVCHGCTEKDTYVEQQFVVNPGHIGYPSDR